MANQNMQLVTVIFMDNDDKLKGTGLHLVGKFEDIIVPEGEDSNTTLLKLAMDGSVKTMLDKHNEKRVKVVNVVTEERTGTKVMLQPVTIEDITITIK